MIYIIIFQKIVHDNLDLLPPGLIGEDFIAVVRELIGDGEGEGDGENNPGWRFF